jgi:outer membrane protein assembly factor BamD (BamD/ComL family)
MNLDFQRVTAICLFLILSFWCSPGSAQAEQTPNVGADLQFEYADSLYAGNDFLLAVGEYKRFIFLFPDHQRVEEAAYKIGLSFLSAGHAADAIASFKKFLRTYPDSRYTDQSHFRISEGYLRSNQAGAAITSLRNLSIITDDTGIRDEAYYRMGWIYIGMGQWEQAQGVFTRISQQNRIAYRLEALSQALTEEPKMKQKSPKLAGTLAVLPGAGYLYCGRYQDALIAFLVNGGLIWAAYESFSNDLVALGTVITFVEIGFYAGNIYGSVSSAHKYNRKNERRWIEQLRKNLKVGLASRPENKGIELSLRYSY